MDNGDIPIDYKLFKALAEVLGYKYNPYHHEAYVVEAGAQLAFQARVSTWVRECFGERIAADKRIRNFRFLEEALELVQSCGCTVVEAHALVDYTFGRPLGEPAQEIGGVMTTLCSLATANGLDVRKCAEEDLAEVWNRIEQIRAKQLTKPNFGIKVLEL